jgi:hypothetical protein
MRLNERQLDILRWIYLVSVKAPRIAGSEGSTGDALRIGRQLGAATGYLDSYQGHAALAMPAATLAGWATVMHGGFLVDRHGRRFGDETAGYSEYASTVLAAASGEAWIVIDRRIHDACTPSATSRTRSRQVPCDGVQVPCDGVQAPSSWRNGSGSTPPGS